MITTILKPFDTFVIFTKKHISITPSVFGSGLTVIPISTAPACGLTFGNEVRNEIVMLKSNKYRKRYEKDEHSNKSLDKLYEKSLQKDLTDEIESESLCRIFTKYLDEKKKESCS